MNKQPFIERAARLAHEVNRAYCEALGDNSQLPWDEAPDWQKESAYMGVEYRMSHPHATPADMHEQWMKVKEIEGWTYGHEKDVVLKTHPCMLPYTQLPKNQQVKDHLFSGVVNALLAMGEN